MYTLLVYGTTLGTSSCYRQHLRLTVYPLELLNLCFYNIASVLSLLLLRRHKSCQHAPWHTRRIEPPNDFATKSLAHVKSETNNVMCNVSPGWDKKHFTKKCSLMRGAGSGGVEENNRQHPSLSDRHQDNVWKVHSIIFYHSSFLPSVWK